MVCDDVGYHDGVGDGCSIDRDGGDGDDYYCCRYYWHWRGWDRRLRFAYDDGGLSFLSRFRSDVYTIDTSR